MAGPNDPLSNIVPDMLWSGAVFLKIQEFSGSAVGWIQIIGSHHGQISILARQGRDR